MKRLRIALLLTFLLSTAAASHAIELHVAPTGDDAAQGTASAPLATLAGARDRVRTLLQDGADEPITVLFAEGEYFVDETVAFDKADSGTEDAPVVYRAADGATVRLTGAKVVNDWKPLTDETVLARLPEESRDKVWVADLAAQGITDYGKLSPRGFSLGSVTAEAELFQGDAPMTLAKWPNEGFQGVESKDGVTRVKVDTDRVARWTEESDPWVFAYWHHDWADLHEPIADIDAANHVLVRRDNIKPQYGVTPGRARWVAYNLLSEIDSPGEYYLDRETGKLFCRPVGQGRATLSITDHLIQCNDASHIAFEGFTIEGCRGNAVTIKDGRSIRVVGCTLRNIAHRAVYATGGEHHEVYGCDVYHCGEGGVSLSGGDRKTLTPAGHNVENNHVHDYSRRSRCYRPGITVSGVGNRIAHNLVHDGPHMALNASGNDHIIEYNEIHNVVHESGDAGAYYVGRDWTQRGNVLRYNYWHQIVGATGHGGMTIYLDDQHCGHAIHGNLFERCSRAVFIGGGDDNIVTNNVFLDCWRPAHIDNRGMGWQKAATDDPNGTLRTRFRSMPVDSDLWKQRYPNLAGTLDDEPNIPKRNVFEKNVAAGGSWDDIADSIRQYQTVKDNLVYEDEKAVELVKDELNRPVELKFQDPSALQTIGFEPLPLKKMGVYEDPRRASWPVEHEVIPIELPEE